MIHIQENVDLTSFNTFGIKSTARYFVTITDPHQLKALLELNLVQQHPKLILGGGSNLLFTKKVFDGLVIKNEIKGIEIVKENDDHIWVKSGAGESWHRYVMYCVDNSWGGLENLSLIPGSVGAAPMQNIGAYGVEVKDTIESVSVFDFKDGSYSEISNKDCHFAYRESMFKHEGKDRYFILNVTFKLTKRNHQHHTTYGAIQDMLSKMNISKLTLRAISDAVIAIRESKLPDPTRIGNAGSFFKNPTITLLQYNELKKEYNNMPMYEVDELHVKVPAGWLIEQCNWKGKTIGNVGVHTQQALVLVNYGGGSGDEIFQLAQSIQQSVVKKFNIHLNMEVNII